MPSRCIHSMIDSRSSSTERSRPLRAESAWCKKLITETPAISCGYWKARNMPDFPRTSAGQVVMSSPLKRIEPSVISYSGLPSSTLASVDLPEPLGPNKAWISPGAIVRSTPRRIGVEPARACRLRTSNSGVMARSLSKYTGICTMPVVVIIGAVLAVLAVLAKTKNVQPRQLARGQEVLLPGPESLVSGTTRPVALGGSIGVEAEGHVPSEVVAVDREVAGVGLDRRPRAPQQPPADAPLVHRNFELRIGVAEVVAQRQQFGGRLDPCGGRDIAVAGGRVGQIGRVPQRVVD